MVAPILPQPTNAALNCFDMVNLLIFGEEEEWKGGRMEEWKQSPSSSLHSSNLSFFATLR
jgi:hypothetical protein